MHECNMLNGFYARRSACVGVLARNEARLFACCVHINVSRTQYSKCSFTPWQEHKCVAHTNAIILCTCACGAGFYCVSDRNIANRTRKQIHDTGDPLSWHQIAGQPPQMACAPGASCVNVKLPIWLPRIVSPHTNAEKSNMRPPCPCPLMGQAYCLLAPLSLCLICSLLHSLALYGHVNKLVIVRCCMDPIQYTYTELKYCLWFANVSDTLDEHKHAQKRSNWDRDTVHIHSTLNVCTNCTTRMTGWQACYINYSQYTECSKQSARACSRLRTTTAIDVVTDTSR